MLDLAVLRFFVAITFAKRYRSKSLNYQFATDIVI